MESRTQFSSTPSAWTYTEIRVHDGDRTLRPTHICSDQIIFDTPPALQPAEVRISIRTGTRETTRTARVLPHALGSTEIPIQLIVAEQNAPAKLTA